MIPYVWIWNKYPASGHIPCNIRTCLWICSTVTVNYALYNATDPKNRNDYLQLIPGKDRWLWHPRSTRRGLSHVMCPLLGSGPIWQWCHCWEVWWGGIVLGQLQMVSDVQKLYIFKRFEQQQPWHSMAHLGSSKPIHPTMCSGGYWTPAPKRVQCVVGPFGVQRPGSVMKSPSHLDIVGSTGTSIIAHVAHIVHFVLTYLVKSCKINLVVRSNQDQLHINHYKSTQLVHPFTAFWSLSYWRPRWSWRMTGRVWGTRWQTISSTRKVGHGGPELSIP